MGQKEKNIIMNKLKKEAKWIERQKEIQRCVTKSYITLLEKERNQKLSYDNGFD